MRWPVLVKVAIAFVALAALSLLPARQLLPDVPWPALLLYVAGGLALALACLALLAVCSLQVSQFILRKGGTDPQWLWFLREPPGLEEMRREQKQGEPRSR